MVEAAGATLECGSAELERVDATLARVDATVKGGVAVGLSGGDPQPSSAKAQTKAHLPSRRFTRRSSTCSSRVGAARRLRTELVCGGSGGLLFVGETERLPEHAAKRPATRTRAARATAPLPTPEVYARRPADNKTSRQRPATCCKTLRICNFRLFCAPGRIRTCDLWIRSPARQNGQRRVVTRLFDSRAQPLQRRCIRGCR